MTAASVALWTLMAGPSRPARVLEIVAGTVYLQVDPLAAADSRDSRDHPGAVVALLAPGSVQLPIGIALSAAAADLVPVSVAGSPVSRGELSIGWGAITLAGVRWPVLRWWNPSVTAFDLPAQSITAGQPLTTGQLSTAGQPDPTGDPLPDTGDPVMDLASELGPGLAAVSVGDAEGAVHQLIGVGTGLIPEGDSVLVGALAALAAWAPDSPSRQALTVAVAGASDRTTRISAALLRAAATGFAVPELNGYLTALSTGEPPVDPALAALAARDASGAAMALGVVHQLRALHSRAPTRS